MSWITPTAIVVAILFLCLLLNTVDPDDAVDNHRNDRGTFL